MKTTSAATTALTIARRDGEPLYLFFALVLIFVPVHRMYSLVCECLDFPIKPEESQLNNIIMAATSEAFLFGAEYMKSPKLRQLVI